LSWNSISLGELCELHYGKGLPAAKRKSGDIPVYSSAGQIDFHDKALVDSEGIIVGRKGSIGTVYYSEKPFYPIDTTYFILPDKGYELRFLYYVLKTLGLEELNSDSAVPGLNRNQAYSQKILVPEKHTQRQISDVLTTYDELIENNLKQINLLEQAAQNIYKDWFVNMRFPGHEVAEFDSKTGLPEGWKLELLSNQLKTIKRKGKLKKDKYLINGNYPVIDQSNSIIGGYSENKELVHFEPLPMVIFGDHTRRVKYVDFPFVSGADGTQLLYPKNKELLPAYFYLAIKNIDLSNYHYARHFKFLKQNSILIPDKNTLESFNNKIEPFLKKITLLNNYNSKLKEARDILLPRLMNQTIEV